MANTSDFKNGLIINHKDNLWKIVEFLHVKPGKGGAFNQVEMKSVNNGTKLNERFRSSDSVEKASLQEQKFHFLYEDGDVYYFINQKSFEQTNIKKKIIGEKGKFLKENLEVIINFYNENPLSVNLPNQIQCEIDITDVALKKQTVSSSYKPAVLDNGLKIQVPPFIESGDIILVDTRTIEYVKKV